MLSVRTGSLRTQRGEDGAGTMQTHILPWFVTFLEKTSKLQTPLQRMCRTGAAEMMRR